MTDIIRDDLIEFSDSADDEVKPAEKKAAKKPARSKILVVDLQSTNGEIKAAKKPAKKPAAKKTVSVGSDFVPQNLDLSDDDEAEVKTARSKKAAKKPTKKPARSKKAARSKILVVDLQSTNGEIKTAKPVKKPVSVGSDFVPVDLPDDDDEVKSAAVPLDKPTSELPFASHPSQLDLSDDDDSQPEPFVKGQTQNFRLRERFDQHKLAYILSKRDDLKDLMMARSFENGKNPFAVLEKYLAKSKNGSVDVVYNQPHGVGRFFADMSLSLQNAPREIRHTIAADYYRDLDMANAHPVILEHLCLQQGIPCPYLSKLNAERDTFLASLNLPRDKAKKVILSLVNGGYSDFKAVISTMPAKAAKRLSRFRQEMKTILVHFATGAAYKAHKKARVAKEITWNHEGSFLNVILCDWENKILQAMLEFFNVKQGDSAVMCFDGLMMPIGAELDIAGAEAYVKGKVGITIALKIKPMDQGFTLPADIPLYENPDKNYFDFTDSYDYQAFRREFNNEMYESREAMEAALHGKHQKVLASILVGEGCIIKKIGDSCDIVRHLGNTGFSMGFKDEEGKKHKIKLSEYIGSLNNHYSEIKCKLDLKRCQSSKSICEDKYFNIWSGFQAKRVAAMTAAMTEGLAIIKDHIMEVWANNNSEYYNYIVSWFAGLFTNLSSINKRALVMVSPPGCGKNTMIELLELLLKKRNILNTTGIASITQKHNSAIQNKRLVVINEMSSTKEEFKSNFDKIKSYITDSTISIEPKGVNAYEIDNISNYMLFTNHRDAVIVEEKDRRYPIFEMNSVHANNEVYFGNIRSKCFNQDVADAFYTYLLDFEAVSLVNIPDTEIRREMINLSKPTPLKFLDALAEEQMFPDMTEVSAAVFYAKYREWCADGGERNVYTNTKFGLAIKGRITKRRKTAGCVYVLPTPSI